MLGKRKIFVAGMWVTIVFGLSQIIRLGSNLVLTRILEPEIFGIMSIVYVVFFGIAMLTDLGLWEFIVRSKDPENSDFLDNMWTLQVIRSWIMFILVAILALALYFGQKYYVNIFHGVYANPLLPFLIFVGSFSIFFDGYKSLASPVLSRKMEVGKLELLDLTAQIVSVTIMIVWVIIYPTIWALLFSSITSNLVTFVLSYSLFPYRHKIKWNKKIASEVYHYSKWIVIASTLTYIFSQGDRLFFGGKISPTMLGIYSIALMLSSSISTILSSLSRKIIFPALSSVVHNDRPSLKSKYYKVRLYSDLMIFILVGVLIATSQIIVDILYDSRYAEAGWMLKILVVSVIGNTLTTVSVECLSALSITKVKMWIMLVRTIGITLGLPIGYSLYGIEGALWAISINVFLPLPIIYWTLNKVNLLDLLKEVRALPMLGIGYILGLLIIRFYKFVV